MRYYCVIFLLLKLVSCKSVGYDPVSIYVTDSFKVNFTNEYEAVESELINETSLITVGSDGMLRKYTFEENQIKAVLKKYLPNAFKAQWYHLSKVKNKLYVVLSSKIILEINQNLEVVDSFFINDVKKNLGERFEINASNMQPLFCFNNNFFINYYHTSLEDYERYFKEFLFTEYTTKKDSLIPVTNHIAQPKQSINQFFNIPYYQKIGDSIAILYAYSDKIYWYNLNNKTLSIQEINNKYFITPDKFNYELGFSETGNAYQTKYKLSNFNYEGLYYLESKRKLVISYCLPLKKNETKKKYYLTVLDLNTNSKKYYYLDKKFMNASTYRCINNKLSIPVYENNFKKLVYYSFGF